MAAWGTECKFRLWIKACMYVILMLMGYVSTCSASARDLYVMMALRLESSIWQSSISPYCWRLVGEPVMTQRYTKQCDAACPLMLLTAKCGSRSTRSASVKPLISKARGRWSTTACIGTPLPRPRIPRPRPLRAPRPLPWAPLPRPGVRCPLLAAWMKTSRLSL